MLTLERLKELFHYDPATGMLTRLVSMGNSQAGAQVTSTNGDGYRIVAIDRKRYKVARVAWFYMTGEWPVAQVDHKDLDRLNDAWSNLRAATHSQNMTNRRFPGCHFADGGWTVRIQKDGVRHYLGRFSSFDAASKAYQAAALVHHGEFACL